MSRRHVNRPNIHSCCSHSNNASLPPRSSGWHQCPCLNKGPHTHVPGVTDFSTCNCRLEKSFSSPSPRPPPGRICMGKRNNSKYMDTSQVTKSPKVVRKTPRPSRSSSPTFLDQLIKGINYLDRSSKSYNNYPKTGGLPQLAATFLEQAASSLYLDHMDQSPTPRASMSTPDHIPNSTCLMPSILESNTLQCLSGSEGMSFQQPCHSQSSTSGMPQKSGLKLPELPLLGNGSFSIRHLPKLWEAMRAGWSAPEPIAKTSDWW